ncbi:ABC transporter ATP-binding protein [Streptomyces sp. NPDC050658]
MRGAALTYAGPPPVEALKPCHIRIHPGEYVTITGPSGSGKSTFLNIAGLLDAPTQGTCLLNGTDTTTLSERDRTALRGGRIGFVFQSFHLVPHRSAVENVMLGMLYNPAVARHERTALARDALVRVGLGHRLNAVPTRLSGGECQRVAIARALATAPSLLLCDEPTGNLDTATAAAVLDLLDALHQDGMTLVVITHAPEVADRGDRRLHIRDGEVSDIRRGGPDSTRATHTAAEPNGAAPCA